MSEPRVVTLDIERQSAIVGGVWQLKQHGYIPPRNIIIPARTICFAWKWWGEDEIHFSSEWDPYDDGTICKPLPYRNTGLLEVYPGHEDMIRRARDVMSQADFVVGWNSKQFDMGNLRSHMAEYNMNPPAPHHDLDLIKVSRSQFGFMSHTLEEAAAHFGLDGKMPHSGELWNDLRWLPYFDPDGEKLQTSRSLMKQYNQRDVELTEQVFMKMIPWIPRLNLYGNPELADELDADIRCRRCNSDDLDWTAAGPRRFSSYWYRRFQCRTCGGWGHGNKSYYRQETSSD
ncbi:DNA polymerase III subunit [Mycobacterium phage Azrael100]|nr:DNA polymerase III subunit [Mycobacterium phage Azrael100]